MRNATAENQRSEEKARPQTQNMLSNMPIKKSLIFRKEVAIMETVDVQKAIKDSIQTEKDAMDYYKYGAERMADEKARKTFELLAREEYQHAESFYKIYLGSEIPSFQEFMNAPPNTNSSWWKNLQGLLVQEFDERKALELAIEQEEALEKQLREMAKKMSDPEVQRVYLSNAASTHHHLELVEEDYKAMFGMS
jgi:rubrerythrin